MKGPSFIPRTTLSKQSYKRPKETNFLVASTVIILIISLGLLGGVFLYKNFLKGNINGLKDKLEEFRRERFEIETIKELFHASSDINSAKTLLSQHKATSNIFKLLEDLTLKEVRFHNLSYSGSAGEHIISMRGEATSYTTVAKQLDVFKRDASIKQVNFSDFALQGQSGYVSFNTSIIINPELLNFSLE